MVATKWAVLPNILSQGEMGAFRLAAARGRKLGKRRASFYFGSNVGIAADDEVTAFMSHDEQRRQQEPVANAMAGTSSAPDRPALTSQCEEDSAVEVA
ncbi:unnamed protein product, partial [Symbiodinium sp. KB8]